MITLVNILWELIDIFFVDGLDVFKVAFDGLEGLAVVEDDVLIYDFKRYVEVFEVLGDLLFDGFVEGLGLGEFVADGFVALLHLWKG